MRDQFEPIVQLLALAAQCRHRHPPEAAAHQRKMAAHPTFVFDRGGRL